jgi:hypothetical protein
MNASGEDFSMLYLLVEGFTRTVLALHLPAVEFIGKPIRQMDLVGSFPEFPQNGLSVLG